MHWTEVVMSLLIFLFIDPDLASEFYSQLCGQHLVNMLAHSPCSFRSTSQFPLLRGLQKSIVPQDTAKSLSRLLFQGIPL